MRRRSSGTMLSPRVSDDPSLHKNVAFIACMRRTRVLLFALPWQLAVQRARVHESFHFRFRWVIFAPAKNQKRAELAVRPDKRKSKTQTENAELISNSTGERTTESMNVDAEMYGVRFKRIRTYWLGMLPAYETYAVSTFLLEPRRREAMACEAS